MPNLHLSHLQVLPAYAKLDSAKAVKAARDDAGALGWCCSKFRAIGIQDTFPSPCWLPET